MNTTNNTNNENMTVKKTFKIIVKTRGTDGQYVEQEMIVDKKTNKCYEGQYLIIPASCEKIGDLDFVKFSLGEYEHTLENSQYIYDADELVVRCSKCGHELEVIRVLQEWNVSGLEAKKWVIHIV